MHGLKPYRTLKEFYPFYLSKHANRTSRRLHFVSTTIALVLVIAVVVTQFWWLMLAALMQGYAFTWVGHFFFERNKPATFTYPWLSFLGDFRLWWEILTSKTRF
ncbi:DUF962 domain-containing protein [Methyloglobulus sp.]|uniref:DUF962 domain-containing protein n=1 Tax=Methyloglobulus sp. TaxID=2518622 RepID=UPI0032B7D3D5